MISGKIRALYLRWRYIRSMGWSQGNEVASIVLRCLKQPELILKWKTKITASAAFEKDETRRWAFLHWAAFLEQWHSCVTGEISRSDYDSFVKDHQEKLRLKVEETKKSDPSWMSLFSEGTKSCEKV